MSAFHQRGTALADSSGLVLEKMQIANTIST